METLFDVTAEGEKTGTKENEAPVRLKPVTCTLLNVLLKFALFGLIDVMTGTCKTVKLLEDDAVVLPILTVIGPVVAPGGTVATKVVGVAEATVAGVPLNWMISLAGVGSNAWPWIVTVWPIGPCRGVKPKTAKVPTAIDDRLICRMLPTGS